MFGSKAVFHYMAPVHDCTYDVVFDHGRREKFNMDGPMDKESGVKINFFLITAISG